MNLIETYIKYFEHQATAHPDIGHTPERPAFQLISIEEAFGDFRTIGKKGVIMRLLEFSHGLDMGTNTLRPLTAGFMIMKYHSARLTGKDGFFEALKESEKITDDIVHKMVNDSQNGHPFLGYSFNTAQHVNITMRFNAGDIAYSGFACVFEIIPGWEVCFDDNPIASNWTLQTGESYQTANDLDWST